MDSTQIAHVLQHLKDHGAITSNEAIKLYGATRLSAIIFILRHDYHYDIETEWLEGTTRYGRKTKYGNYIFHGKEEEDGQGKVEEAGQSS